METLFTIDNVIATLIEFKSAEENKKIAEAEKIRRAQILMIPLSFAINLASEYLSTFGTSIIVDIGL